MTTSTLLPISIQKTMSQDQIEDLSPEEFSMFLANGELPLTKVYTPPHSVVYFHCENNIHSRITWV